MNKIGCVGYLLACTGVAATYVLLVIWQGWQALAWLLGTSFVVFVAMTTGSALLDSYRNQRLSREASRLRANHTKED